MTTDILRVFSETNESSQSNFLEKIKTLLNYLGGSSPEIWLPIVIFLLLIISFIVGYFMRFKYIPFKIAALGFTIFICYFAYDYLVAELEKKDIYREYKDLIPLVITLFALLTYWFWKFIFFIFIGIIHLVRRKKRKLKNQKISRRFKIFKGTIFGLTNTVLSIPGTFLFANVLSIKGQKDSYLQKGTNWSVELMTSKKGSSLTGLVTISINGIESVQRIGEITEYFKKPTSQRTPEDRQQVLNDLKNFGILINDSRIRPTILNLINKNGMLDSIKQEINESLKDKILTKIRSEKLLEYDAQRTPEAKKEYVNNYISENIHRLFKEYVVNNDTKPQLELAQNIFKELKEDSNKDLLKTIYETVKEQTQGLEEVLSVEKLINVLTNQIKIYQFNDN